MLHVIYGIAQAINPKYHRKLSNRHIGSLHWAYRNRNEMETGNGNWNGNGNGNISKKCTNRCFLHGLSSVLCNCVFYLAMVILLAL